MYSSRKGQLLGMDLKSRPSGKRAFTRLHASIWEEDGAFTVNVRLHNHLDHEDTAWGQEIAASFEMASLMISSLAEAFSIPQKCIAIKIRMQNFRSGTLH